MKKLLTIIATSTLFFSCGSSTPDESDAKQAARAAIIHNLKNPVDAKFHQNEIIKDLGNNTYLYKETVNATNSYGGSIAQDVTATVKWLTGDPSEVQNWTVVNIEYIDR